MSLTSQRICKFFQEKGKCIKGDQCDFSHNLDLQPSGQRGGSGQGARSFNKRPGPDSDRWDRKQQDDFQPPQKRNYNYSSSGGGGGSNFNNQPRDQYQSQPNNPQPNRYPANNDFQSNNRQNNNFQSNNRSNNDSQSNNRPPKYTNQYYNDLVPLTNFQINEFIKFLPVFKIGNNSLVGFVCEKEINFYQINLNLPALIDTLSPQKLQFSNVVIKNAWLQNYQDDVILMVAYKTQPNSQTLSLALYVSLIKNQENHIQIMDVCNGNISGCHMDIANQHLYAFCQDKQIRVFKYDQVSNKMVIGCSFEVPSTIECSVQLPGTTNGFLFGGQNGLLGSLVEGVLTIFQLKLDQKTILEIVCDAPNKRFFLLVWAADKTSDVFILQDGPSLGDETVFHFGKQITKIQYSQNASNQNMLLVANVYGSLISLQEKLEKPQQTQQSSEMMGEEERAQSYLFKRYNQYPEYIKGQQSANLPPISDILSYDHRNENNASFKYLFIGRVNQPNSGPNVEIFSLTMPQ